MSNDVLLLGSQMRVLVASVHSFSPIEVSDYELEHALTHSMTGLFMVLVPESVGIVHLLHALRCSCLTKCVAK